MPKGIVEHILRNASKFTWTLQGLGMLRLNISNEMRLHVWNSTHSIRDVSAVHDHPWDFTSYVVAGIMEQIRYTEVNRVSALHSFEHYKKTTIKCGQGACKTGQVTEVGLRARSAEHYTAGESYSMTHDEIHHSMPRSGTVTLIKRVKKPDQDHATVYWQKGEWVSAEPRPATPEEINEIVGYSLKTWFEPLMPVRHEGIRIG